LPAVVDGGNPFGRSKAITAAGAATDEAPSPLTGYPVLQAESPDAATKLAGAVRFSRASDVYETTKVM
jgi:hypothetical protein